VDDRTCVWYGAWGGGGPHGVRLATWPRDRLGYLEIIPLYDGVHGTWVPPQFVTAPVSITSAASLFVNADRLSHEAYLKFSSVTKLCVPSRSTTAQMQRP